MNSSSEEEVIFSPPTSPVARIPSPLSPNRFSPPSSPLVSSRSLPSTSHGIGSVFPTDSDTQDNTPRKKIKKRHGPKVSRSTYLRKYHIELCSDSSSDEKDFDDSVLTSDIQQIPGPSIITAAGEQMEDHRVNFISDSSDTSNEDSQNSSSSDEFSSFSYSSSKSASNSSDECSVHSNVTSVSDSDDDELYLGADVSVDEAILKVLQVYISQRWTKKSLDSNVKIIKSLLPKPNLFPTTGKKLLSNLGDLSAYQIINEHFYCCKCQREKANEKDSCLDCIDCRDCKDKDENIMKNCDCQKTGVFFEFSIEQQVKYMFEHRNLASAINQYHREKKIQPGCICDITDGSEYLKVRSQISGRYDLVLLTSTDGVELSTSSKQEMWPILSVPCEVLPNRRPYYMIVSGVYVDSKKPDMNTYFKPFVNSLRNIYRKGGVQWTCPESEVQNTSQIVSPVFSLDAPAKAIVLNVKNHNHRFGCNVCEQKAVRVNASNNENNQQAGRKGKNKKMRKQKVTVRRFVFTEEEAPLRTKERMFALSELAEARGKSRKGVIGHSVVSKLPLFDRAQCISAEYLHVVLLGVVKYILNIMCTVSGPWSIKCHIKTIDLFIKSIKVPDYVKRLPRGLHDIKFWKGSELRAFLLFYSLPALQPHLPAQYFQHWMLLVISINILLQDCIPEEELRASEIMLRCFVREVGELYHKRFYTYNIHNLLHLCTLVRRWGNLWATSAFDFESYNGFITSHVHGTKHLGKELLNNIKIIQSTKVLEMKIQTKGLRNSCKKGFETCGSKLSEMLSNEEKLALDYKNIETFELYERIKINSQVYTSRHYDKNVRRANSYVQFEGLNMEAMYGEILYFVKDLSSHEMYALLNLFKIKHTNLFFLEESLYKVKHLLPVVDSGEIIAVPISSLSTKIIKAGQYICLRPNPYEVNL